MALTKADIAKYKEGCKDIKLTHEDFAQIDGDRMESIGARAVNDVLSGSKRRERSAFKNDAEYKYYMLCVYNEASYAEHRI